MPKPHTHKTSSTHAQRFTKLMHFVLQIRNVPIKQIQHASETNRACFTHTKKDISSSTKKYLSSTKNNSTSMKKKLSCDFWHYFSALLIHTHTNASKLSNKCPVIRTPQQQVVLLRPFKAGRTIFFHPYFNFLFFYFIQGCNRIYHRHIDASLSAGPYTDVTIMLEKEAPPGELSCIITVTALQTFAAVNIRTFTHSQMYKYIQETKRKQNNVWNVL